MKYQLGYFVFVAAVATAATTAQYETQGPMFSLPSFTQNDLPENFNYFDLELLKSIASSAKDENILLSPLSIKNVLAMILEGAVGQSATELRSALRLSSNRALVRQQMQKLLSDLTLKNNNIIIESSNRVFVSDKVQPVPEYLNVLKRYYFSNVTKINVSAPHESADLINYWVRRETHGLITSLVSPNAIHKDTSVILANALYFNGSWEKSFDEENTIERCFYVHRDECTTAYIMQTIDTFKYANLEEMDAQAVELAYKGGEYAMLVILPNKIDGITQVVRDILHNPIHKIVNKLKDTKIEAWLPRFTVEYNQDMVEYLQKLDIFEIFGPEAQLNGLLSQGNVRVSNIIHKTKMSVNEKGVVAAATSGAVLIPLIGPTRPRVQADHPFLFFLRHVPTGTILFEGKLTKPDAVEPKLSTNQEVQQQQPLLQQRQQQLQQQPQRRQQQPQQPQVLSPLQFSKDQQDLQYPEKIVYLGQVNYPHRQN